MRQICRAAWVGVLLAIGGCSTAYHARAISDPHRGHSRLFNLEQLRYLPSDHVAAEGYRAALMSDDYALCYFAAEALDSKLFNFDDPDRAILLSALIEDLDVARCGCYTIPIFPLFPVGYYASTGSVRARVLLTLTQTRGGDHGFDKAAWYKSFKLTAPAGSAASSPE